MHTPDPRTPSGERQADPDGSAGERPPVFSTWTSWYLLVLGTLIALILLFYWLTRHFS